MADLGPRFKRTAALCGLAVVAAAIGAVLLVRAIDPAGSPQALRQLGAIVLPEPHDLEPFELVDQNGDPYSLEGLRGRWSFVFFGYTHCPDICPVTLSTLAQSLSVLASEQPSLRERTQIVLMSVDPERDKPEVLARYLSGFGPGIIGLTGDAGIMKTVAADLYANFEAVPAPASQLSYLVDHSGNIALVNPEARLHGFFKPPFEPHAIAQALATISAL